ncbi:dehydrogenase [Marinithermofilum abyssi]|uniref:Dehydrogenase n=1 Tax=Marinithermofilum abyssi TaxID=1571185 RepID=A0A8J2YDN9_9BACL|nr:Gfo/Idh/MocA family oxidoreductase [Marinithermofilum abyssi]GGE12338.1 dehydrogenase [Marinithermofilum abyssi]
MGTKLRVGVIGAGGIATQVHMPNYQQCEEAEIVAVADIHEAKAQAAAEEFQIPRVYTDYREMLAHEDLDAVSVCTPNKFHAPATLAALEAGCHVLCEKPPAMTTAEAEEMRDTARRTGKLLTFGLHYRQSSEVSTLKRFVDEGELGKVYASRVHAVRRRGIPGWGVFTNKELQGGGPLIDIGVHMLDTALYLMGYPQPTTVFGVTYQKLGNRKGVGLFGEWDWQNYSVEDMARGMITFENGASILLESAFAANVQKDDEMNVSLMGEQGGADVFPLRLYQEKHGALIDVTPAYLPETNAHKNVVHRFVKACQGQAQPSLCTPEQGVILQQIIEALYRSAEEGEPVKVSAFKPSRG